MAEMRPSPRGAVRWRQAALAAVCLFALQLVLAGLGSILPTTASAGLPVPICADGHVAWVDPADLPDQGMPEDGSTKGTADCAKCCPHVQGALVPPGPSWLLQRRHQLARGTAIPRPSVRVGRSTAPPPPSRGPPVLAG
jgi:hypothetical protein